MLKTDFNGIIIPRKKKKKRSVDETQEWLFDAGVQSKYPGPKTVPHTSLSAYNEIGTHKKMSGGVAIAKNLLRRFPDKTAYELLNLSQTFTDIYDLRRYLSSLKKDGVAYNPAERMCAVARRKTFTWRLR